MLPTIATGNVGSALAGGYEVDNSLRFDDGSSDYLKLTLPQHHGAVYKWTYSFWVKRSALGSLHCMIGTRYSGSYTSQIRFNADDTLEVHDYRTSYALRKITTRKFRDTLSWYHIVISNDNSVSSPDLKFYINGVEETDFSTDNEYSQNQTTSFNNIYPNYIGHKGTGNYFDGYLSEVAFIDGTAYDQNTFGEFDDSGIWKPKDFKDDVTWGDNGFYQEYKQSGTGTDSSGMGADTSSNNNHFAVYNLTSVSQSTDTCTNNFCTLNNLNFGNGTLSKANLKWTASGSSGYLAFGTIGFDISVTNNFYWETKIDSIGSGVVIGIAPTILRWNDTGRAGSYGYYSNGDKYNGTSASTYGASFTTGDTIGVLVGNGSITFYKNGSTQGTAYSSLSGTWLPFLAEVGQTNSMNFGSPPYSITSGNSDPNGYGNFEHSTNGGYALNTKNLAEFG